MCSDHIILLMIISFLAMIYAKFLLHPSKKRFLLHGSLKASVQRNLKRCSKLVSATCASPQRALPIIIWLARHGRRHPRSKGPGKEFIYFFFKRNGPHSYDFILGPATITVALEAACRKPMGIITRVVAMEGNPIGSRSSLLPAASMCSFLSPHASAKASYTAFFIQQHSKRNHQSKLLTKACIFAATTSESQMHVLSLS